MAGEVTGWTNARHNDHLTITDSMDDEIKTVPDESTYPVHTLSDRTLYVPRRHSTLLLPTLWRNQGGEQKIVTALLDTGCGTSAITMFF